MPANPDPEKTPEEQLAEFHRALQEEYALSTEGEGTTAQAELFIRDNALLAAQRLVETMNSSHNERIVVACARFILDRSIFDVGGADEDLAATMKKLMRSTATTDSNPTGGATT